MLTRRELLTGGIIGAAGIALGACALADKIKDKLTENGLTEMQARYAEATIRHEGRLYELDVTFKPSAKSGKVAQYRKIT